MVQFGRSATGASSNGVTTRNAAALFTGAGPGRHRRFERRHTIAHEFAAPKPHRVLAYAEGLRDARARPAGQRQQHRTRAIRFAAIPRPGQSHQHRALFLGRQEWRVPGHMPCTSDRSRQQIGHQPLVKLRGSA